MYIFLLIFTCTPVVGNFHYYDFAWRSQNELHCMDEGAIIVSCAIVSSMQDFIICFLPAFLIWNLQMPRRQKMALQGVFALGLVTFICGILRTFYATRVYYFSYDITWTAYHGWVWTALEADFAVICASAPALKVFFRRYFSSITSRTETSNKTPIEMSRARAIAPQVQSGTSTSIAQVGASNWPNDGLPFDGIKVSQGLEVLVEDNVSQKSFASTKNLTALPTPRKAGWLGPQDWTFRIVCAALRSGSRGTSRTRSLDKDVERGASDT